MAQISDELSTALGGLSRLLLSPPATDVTLQRVAHLAQSLAKHCHAVSITLRHGGELTTAAPTDELAREIDAVQYESGKGPCLEASEQLQVFIIPSMADDRSWPEFAAAALDRGIMSSLSVPLTFGGQVLGAINMYSHQSHAFDKCREVSLIFAAQAGAALAEAELREASERYLEEAGQSVPTGDVVAQAKELLMARHGCTADQALEILRQRSGPSVSASTPG